MQNIAAENISIGPEINWPKEFPELKLIDDAVRCGICYDYIKTCMVTPCAHSYCSICIRRSLMYKTACPTCFEETYETSLRNNRVLDRLIELFVAIRDKLIKHIRIAAIHFNGNEMIMSPSQYVTSQKNIVPESTPKRVVQKTSKTSSTKGKLNFPSTSVSSSASNKSDISKRLEDILGSPAANGPVSSELDCSVFSNENEFLKVPPMFLQPKVEERPRIVDVPSVPCPVCDVQIPERNINAHLDHCLANVDKPPVKSPEKNKQKRPPLPKMVWSLMAEKDLRKKLKDYNLNTQGDKKTLITRLQRYILLYNSECDGDNPRPVSDIVRQVEREEKPALTQNQQRLFMNSKTDPKIIEEENKKYIQENKDSFNKLIEAMKERGGRSIRPTKKPSNQILSDDERDLLDDEEHIKKFNCSVTKPSTSKVIEESINLCDSNDDSDNHLSASPVLGSWMPDNQVCNGFISGKSDDYELLEEVTKTPVMKKNCRDNPTQMNKTSISPGEESSDSKDFEGLHSRTPSPSCIITAHTSDSEDSISILINQDINEDFPVNKVTEPFSENDPNVNSQLDDPDFVMDSEQFEVDNNSDEVFIPRRKSKRKCQSPVVPETKQTPSPRRTRRRLTK